MAEYFHNVQTDMAIPCVFLQGFILPEAESDIQKSRNSFVLFMKLADLE
jgi:hypothetical protein